MQKGYLVYFNDIHDVRGLRGLEMRSKTPRNLQISKEKVDPPARYLELYQMGHLHVPRWYPRKWKLWK